MDKMNSICDVAPLSRQTGLGKATAQARTCNNETGSGSIEGRKRRENGGRQNALSPHFAPNLSIFVASTCTETMITFWIRGSSGNAIIYYIWKTIEREKNKDWEPWITRFCGCDGWHWRAARSHSHKTSDTSYISCQKIAAARLSQWTMHLTLWNWTSNRTTPNWSNGFLPVLR